MPFQNPVVGGNGTLIRSAIKSPDYVSGVSGWQIARDGTAEFNDVDIRGSLEVRDGAAVLMADVDPVFGVALTFNPNEGTFENGRISTGQWPSDPDRGYLTFQSPNLPGYDRAGMYLYSESPAIQSHISFQGKAVHATNGFVYEGMAFESRNPAPTMYIGGGGNINVIAQQITSDFPDAYFEIKAGWHAINIDVPAAVPNNRFTMCVTRNGGQIAGRRLLGLQTTVGQLGGQICIVDNPGVGTHTYALNLVHEAGSAAASVRCDANANSPATISIRGFGR